MSGSLYLQRKSSRHPLENNKWAPQSDWTQSNHISPDICSITLWLHWLSCPGSIAWIVRYVWDDRFLPGPEFIFSSHASQFVPGNVQSYRDCWWATELLTLARGLSWYSTTVSWRWLPGQEARTSGTAAEEPCTVCLSPWRWHCQLEEPRLLQVAANPSTALVSGKQAAVSSPLR